LATSSPQAHRSPLASIRSPTISRDPAEQTNSSQLQSSVDIKVLAFWTGDRISQQFGSELKKHGIAYKNLTLEANTF
jgi:hypothetical protein